MRVDYQRQILSKTIEYGGRRFTPALSPKLDRKIGGGKVVGILSFIDVARASDMSSALGTTDFTGKPITISASIGCADKDQKTILGFSEGRGKPRTKDRVTKFEGSDPPIAADQESV